jgi:hypothetical protein
MADLPDAEPTLGRRAFLAGLGAGAGLLAVRGLGADGWPTAEADGSYEALVRRLALSLTPGQRARIVLPADHPSRQITNTLAFLDRPHLGTLLSPGQQALVRRLCDAMLSPRGRAAFAGTLAVEGRLEGCVLALYGEPETGRAQAALMGGHVHLRGGGTSPEGAALGGGVAYGHQVGNGRWRVPGNSFAWHGDAANRLYAALALDERRRAVVDAAPHELVLQPRGAGATLPGVAVGSLSERGRDEAARLLDAVLSLYPEEGRREALACIDANGGRDALHVAYSGRHGFYEDLAAWGALDPAERARRGDPYWQVWRIEGPGAVIHFQGHPHVHAYVNVVRDPARANLGEALGETSTALEGAPLQALLEAALRRATGEPLAFHGPDLPGRFCTGTVTSGLAYALDPYGNHVVVAEIEGRALAAPLREHLRAAGTEPAARDRVRVASIEYVARQAAVFGEPARIEKGDLLLRDALVAHLRAGGLAGDVG